VALSPGANQLTAVATDVDGITAQRQITVSYTPPPAQPHLALLGAPRAASAGVTFRVSCSAASCKGSAALTATEILKGQQKLTGVGAKTRRKVVKVGRVSFSLNAGAKKSVTVRLNSLGRKLLKRFKRLPVKLSVSLVPAGGKATAVATKRLTIKAKRPRKH
jgi:hypothetical protein